MKGTYIFYEDGKEIARHENVITKFGKRFITNYLAGNVQFGKKDIAIGIAGESNYPAADTNSRLGFEFYRLPVTFGTFDIASDGLGGYTYAVIYKTTLPQDVSGYISEIGLYPGTRTSINNYDSQILSNFEENMDWTYSNGSHPSLINTTTPLVGDYFMSLEFAAGDTTSTTREIKYNRDIDLSGYSGNDTLDIALYRVNTNSASVKVKFYSSDTDYYYGTYTLSGTGNKIISIPMSDVFTNYSGTPIASDISKIGVEVTRTSAASSGTVYLDGLRINDEDTFDPSFGLVSRSTFSAIQKVAGRKMDIEYKLDLGFTV